MTSQASLDEWVDIFGEMFSERCRQNIKHATIPDAEGIRIYHKRLRLFYAYWSLKEAFIKMVGEGLLAEWLKELEFEHVIVPAPATTDDFSDNGFSWALNDEEDRKWTPPAKAAKDIKAVLYSRKLDDVHLELVSYEQDFLLATAMRAVTEATGVSAGKWIKLDIEKDIRPCAEGRCRCLDPKADSAREDPR